MPHPKTNPVVVVGAFERHNFGDLLMGRIAEFFSRDQGLTPIPASLLAADLRSFGGGRTHAFSSLAPKLSPDVPILHVGGETIPCQQQAALRMNVPAAWPSAISSQLVKAHDPTGLETRRFAYITPPIETIRDLTHRWNHRFFHALGASTLALSDPQMRESIGEDLKEADWITAREQSSVTALRQAGLPDTQFAWDTAVLQPVLEPGGLGALDTTPLRQADGPLLVQANAHFLRQHGETLATAIARVAHRFPCIRIAFAGLAAQHDTMESLAELARHLGTRGCTVHMASDPHALAIVEEIKNAACVVSTSLHFRIIALTHGVPRVSLPVDKLTNWARCCDPTYPFECAADSVAEAVNTALEVPHARAIECAMTARGGALLSMHALMRRVSDCATSANARWQSPTGEGEVAAPLPSDHVILPRVWIDALGPHLARLSAELDNAHELNRTTQEEIRRLRGKRKPHDDSVPGRILRFFGG